MKNRTTYLRTTKNNNFVRTDLGITKLPIIESGIMFKILSNTNEWVFNKDFFQINPGIGKDRFDRAWNNLIKLGYIIQEKISDGKSFGWDYIFTESPSSENTKSGSSNIVKSDRRKTQDGIIRQIEILPSENTLLITSNLNNETEHLKIGPDTGPDIKKKGKKDTQPEKTGPKKINIPDNQDENTGPKEKISTVDVSSYVKPEQEFTPTKNFQIDFYNLDPVLKRIVNSEYFQLPKESRPALEQFYNKWKLQPESIELISTLS